MKKTPKQECTAEFNEQAVKHAQAVGIVVAAKELGLIEQTPRNWGKATEAGQLVGAGAKPVTPEQVGHFRRRAEDERLKMHVEILEKVPQPWGPSEAALSASSDHEPWPHWHSVFGGDCRLRGDGKRLHGSGALTHYCPV